MHCGYNCFIICRASQQGIEYKTEKEKINAFLTSFVMSLISIILIAADCDKGVTISITLVAVAILMVIGILVQDSVK